MSKQPKKSKDSVQKGKKQEQTVMIKPDYSQPFPVYYSNYAAVSHTPYDLTIDFCILAPPHKVDPEGKAVIASMVSRIVVPPEMAQGLIEALRIRLERQRKEREGEIPSLEVEIESAK